MTLEDSILLERMAIAASVDPCQASTLMTLRIQMGLADAIADAAEAGGTTQKVIITRAREAVGFNVAPVNLEDRTPRRRR